ncbi:MAG: hypothetical protein QGI21_01420 [Candidatus Poseidoniaceae archaeon]|jgi:hypothetical protein|nr:hypothetical protein [Candidatus Poseidoniaceae archaeon]
MAKKPSKALRGKHRWIGCRIEGFSNRDELKNFLSGLPVNLYDMSENKCIIKVGLTDYRETLECLKNGRVVSITSSGKIKLVRDRLQIDKSFRKR